MNKSIREADATNWTRDQLNSWLNENGYFMVGEPVAEQIKVQEEL